jgi:hypothetical protein
MNKYVYSSQQESIIEVSNKKGPGNSYHYFDNYNQVLSVVMNEDKWVKKKDILNIEAIFYDSEKYNLLFLPKDNKLEYETQIIENGAMYILVKRKTFLPRKIKAGTVLGEAILVPKIQSHFLLLNQ